MQKMDGFELDGSTMDCKATLVGLPRVPHKHPRTKLVSNYLEPESVAGARGTEVVDPMLGALPSILKRGAEIASRSSWTLTPQGPPATSS